jgi:hypothetical protein
LTAGSSLLSDDERAGLAGWRVLLLKGRRVSGSEGMRVDTPASDPYVAGVRLMAENTPVPPAPGGVPSKAPEAAKVQPKKETVRITLPPKPSASPTIKIPAPPTPAARPAAPAAAPAAAAAATPAPAPAPAAPRPTAAAAAPAPRPAVAPRPVAVVPAISGVDKGLAIAAAVLALGALVSVLLLG